ncbi:Glu/Leu/Phe/Val family dehydrogenase [Sphingomonas sp.]|uniref:Glu/Leu/Phe/Val family dehydrogenase n=1 Tax=Sphingomonas sp. TaxID=28214 RepID=UPI002DBA5233|nr:Glu/Leu/Phe/Val dehydrogenase dimerization domain-containing protein [Sphingomonas sp.]HEU4969377.1 Glu/Leu/Phe/Val dehydrogenase dimerization domain-containing protein [Sphingomonas sp.]
MTAWDLPDFDDHEGVHLFRDRASGLTAVVAVHSSALGPAMGGVRFWHYPNRVDALTDALRLSRGMSYKNAMAGLPLGGGKGVILADAAGTKTASLLQAFGKSVDSLGGRYVTAEDVGISTDDMVAISKATKFVSGLPVAEGSAGGDPGPFTAYGVFLGVKAAVKRGLGKDSVNGVHVAVQGLGSVGGRLARLLAEEGAKLTLADVNGARAAALAKELGGKAVEADEILGVEADVISPNALGAILTEGSIAALKAPVVAGGANNQLATPEDGDRIHARGILFAPDYVINAGGIINVGLEYLGRGDEAEVRSRIRLIPDRLEQVWAESATSGDPAARVADRIAQRLIGRG